MNKNYGIELILDIHQCRRAFNRVNITNFMRSICSILDMERHDLHFWDYDTVEDREVAPAHLAGTSAVQFITTSNITIHTLDRLQAVYLNIFTCADLDQKIVEKFCQEYWQGTIVNSTLIERK